ncbi:thioredoxin domain-containing protein [Nocardiopsis ganjiahuensis]|uniref:thioredoxin family protein n=1 Tax=Nocardiopsis ganjiahuensis TaxID=239984 RepID=UPI001EF9F983|nr:thioredoxin family protein [Nocardiopsis ganjiahuensis]
MLTATMAVGLALTACGSDPEDTANAVTPAPEASEEINRALSFQAETTWGEEFDGESLDQVSAVLWFWSADCVECVPQAPLVLAAADNHDDIEFHGVAGRGEPDDLLDFEMTHGLDAMTNVIDADGLIWAGFGVISPPTLVFISPDGTHTTVPGAMTEHELEIAISEELG